MTRKELLLPLTGFESLVKSFELIAHLKELQRRMPPKAKSPGDRYIMRLSMIEKTTHMRKCASFRNNSRLCKKVSLSQTRSYVRN